MGEKGNVKKFEDLMVYQKAMQLVLKIYNITEKEKFSKDFALVNQIRRSSVSVPSNIAEGFERGSNKDFEHFLYIAKGSNAELKCQLNIAYKLGYFAENEYEYFMNEISEITKMLVSYIRYLASASIKNRK